MLKVTYPDGTVAEATDKESEQTLLADANKRRAYTVQALAVRLNISERCAYDLIREGKIAYVCAGGTKGYRVGEPAVERYLNGFPPLTPAA
jgi:excisionase family DNA binding protein